MKTLCSIMALAITAALSAADWGQETLVSLSTMKEFEKEGAFGTLADFGVIMGNGVPLTKAGTPDLGNPGESGFLIMAFKMTHKDAFLAFVNRSPAISAKSIETAVANDNVYAVHEWGGTQGTMQRLKAHLQID